MKNHTIRMTDEEWEKLQLMGGAAWIREKIDYQLNFDKEVNRAIDWLGGKGFIKEFFKKT